MAINFFRIWLFMMISSIPGLYSSLIASDQTSPDSAKRFSNISLLVYYKKGTVLQTNSFVRGNNQKQKPINAFQAISLQLCKQTTGEKLWEQLYKYPRLGVGFYAADFVHSTEIGKPLAIYGLLTIPLFRGRNLAFNTDLGFGFATNWESFGEDSYNIALGAEQSIYLDAGLSLEYTLKNGFLVNLGASFTHFSNGALKVPNYGINTFAPKISLGYNFNRNMKSFNHQTVPEFQKNTDCFVTFFTGWKNVIYKGNNIDSATRKKGVYYSAYGFSASLNRNISYKSKFGLGLTVDYLGAANSTITVHNGKLEYHDASLSKGLELSVFPSYELVINRLSLLLQPGFYLYRTKYAGRVPATYQRIGLKFKIYKEISFGMSLRAYHFYISDYIEWTVGYTFF